MSSPMDAVRDILPTPENTEAVTAPQKEELHHSLEDEATLSHSLAVADHDEKGHAQADHDEMVKNLGWHEPDYNIANPLVGRLPNEELWLLLRRFNKVTKLIRRVCEPH